jgi:4-hydroxy-tetrahydrodipicolinate synthase
MARFKDYQPEGVIAACLLPFREDLTIDERAYREHIRQLAAVEGVSAITVNGHSCEVPSLSFEEQQRVLEITADELGDKIPIIHGVYADGSIEAARLARMGERAGAAGLLVFPPNPFIMGAQRRPEMALKHFETIAAATDLPLIVFQYPLGGGQGYPLTTLLMLAEQVPSVRAIKDWCGDPALHQRHISVLQSLARPVNVLTTHSAWLLSSLVLGCRGLLSGSGSVIADLHVALWRAVRAGDLGAARALNERIRALSEVFYADPWVDMHNRMKEAMVILGRMRCAAVRPPLVKLDPAEIERIRAALKRAGVRKEGAFI